MERMVARGSARRFVSRGSVLMVVTTALLGGQLAMASPVSTASVVAPSRPAPPPLPSAARSTAGLQVAVGDVRNPPEFDPATGARVGLAAKPEETPAGGHLVAQSATSDTYALATAGFWCVPIRFR